MEPHTEPTRGRNSTRQRDVVEQPSHDASNHTRGDESERTDTLIPQRAKHSTAGALKQRPSKADLIKASENMARSLSRSPIRNAAVPAHLSSTTTRSPSRGTGRMPQALHKYSSYAPIAATLGPRSNLAIVQQSPSSPASSVLSHTKVPGVAQQQANAFEDATSSTPAESLPPGNQAQRGRSDIAVGKSRISRGDLNGPKAVPISRYDDHSTTSHGAVNGVPGEQRKKAVRVDEKTRHETPNPDGAGTQDLVERPEPVPRKDSGHEESGDTKDQSVSNSHQNHHQNRKKKKSLSGKTKNRQNVGEQIVEQATKNTEKAGLSVSSGYDSQTRSSNHVTHNSSSRGSPVQHMRENVHAEQRAHRPHRKSNDSKQSVGSSRPSISSTTKFPPDTDEVQSSSSISSRSNHHHHSSQRSSQSSNNHDTSDTSSSLSSNMPNGHNTASSCTRARPGLPKVKVSEIVDFAHISKKSQASPASNGFGLQKITTIKNTSKNNMPAASENMIDETPEIQHPHHQSQEPQSQSQLQQQQPYPQQQQSQQPQPQSKSKPHKKKNRRSRGNKAKKAVYVDASVSTFSPLQARFPPTSRSQQVSGSGPKMRDAGC